MDQDWPQTESFPTVAQLTLKAHFSFTLYVVFPDVLRNTKISFQTQCLYCKSKIYCFIYQFFFYIFIYQFFNGKFFPPASMPYHKLLGQKVSYHPAQWWAQDGKTSILDWIINLFPNWLNWLIWTIIVYTWFLRPLASPYKTLLNVSWHFGRK